MESHPQSPLCSSRCSFPKLNVTRALLLGFGPVREQHRKSRLHSWCSAPASQPQGPFSCTGTCPLSPIQTQLFPLCTSLIAVLRAKLEQGRGQHTRGVCAHIHSVTFLKPAWQ